jgi:copper chaperone NosL
MKFRTAVFALTLLGLLVGASCSSVKTAPIYAGDTCFRCGRIISDVKVVAEVVDQAGRAYKFRTVGCMAKYFKDHPQEVATSKIFVADATNGRFIQAKNAIFVPAWLFEGSERQRDYRAFAAASEARKVADQELSQPTDWAGVLKAD